MNIKRQQGFTLIELIMVIVILGILAATALPKFVNMGSDARTAALKSLQGSINSAVAVATATYLVRQSSPITLSDGSTTVTVNTNGYPTGDAAGIGTMINISSDFTVAYAAGVATYTLASKANCTVAYTASTGTTSLTSSGC
jgi:MSHA pilin protein MshA